MHFALKILVTLLISSLAYGEKEELEELVIPDRLQSMMDSIRAETPTEAMQEMCEKYSDGIACARIRQITERKRPCSCSSVSREQVTTDNQEFLDYHKVRIETDIEEINEKLNPLGGHTHLKPWQITNLRNQLQKKEDILKRTLRYIDEFDFLPQVQLIVDDLSVDFTVEDCGRLAPLLDNRFFTKNNLMISKTPYRPNRNFDAESETLRARCQNIENDPNQEMTTEASFCIDCRANSSITNLDETIQSNIALMDNISCQQDSLSCHEDPSSFLRSLGIDPSSSSNHSERDLSHFYTEPHSQGGSSACAGFAVSADIEAEVHKMSLGGFELPPPNPWDTYEVLNGGFSACQGQVEGRNYSTGTLMGTGLSNLASSSLCADGLDRRYKVESTSALNNTDSVDFNFVKQMIDNDKPFVAGLNSTGSRITEDWSYPTPTNSGNDGHVLTVVGYGNGLSPDSRESEPYVIVRDSLNGESTHTKMRFEDFQQSLTGVWKVQNVSFD